MTLCFELTAFLCNVWKTPTKSGTILEDQRLWAKVKLFWKTKDFGPKWKYFGRPKWKWFGKPSERLFASI